jgi:hypothetical protein
VKIVRQLRRWVLGRGQACAEKQKGSWADGLDSAPVLQVTVLLHDYSCALTGGEEGNLVFRVSHVSISMS